MGWSGIKLGQDSLMWVPPLNGGVSMHQDNPYQDWHTKKQTITCIIALTKYREKFWYTIFKIVTFNKKK